MAAKDQGQDQRQDQEQEQVQEQDQEQDQEQVQGQARFVYISRFGSYRCGGVWQLGGPKAQRRCPPALAAQSREQELLRPEAAPGQAAKACATARWQALRVRSPGRQTARARGSAGFNRKGAGEEFDFPIPLDGAAKITKKKKKVSVWNSVHKVISKLLKENERYRLRLKCQKASSDN